MKLEGKIYKANLIIAIAVIELEEKEKSFSKNLENCLIKVCKELNIAIPLWFKKNTNEFAQFRQTIFFEEQFIEKPQFERFQIKLLK